MVFNRGLTPFAELPGRQPLSPLLGSSMMEPFRGLITQRHEQWNSYDAWNHLGHFTSFRQSDGSGFSIRLANGTRVQSAGIGDIGPLRRVLYVPEMAHCLISARVLAADESKTGSLDS